MDAQVKSTGLSSAPGGLLLRYYLSAKFLSQSVTMKTETLRQVYITLQFLPLVVTDSQETQELPWDFSNFWWLWNGLSVLTRLERALRLLALSPVIFVVGSCILTGVRAGCMAVLTVEAAGLTPAQFDTRLTREKYSVIARFGYKVDRIVRTFTSYCLPIALLSFFSSLTFCADGICGIGATVYIYWILGVVSLIFTAFVVVWDRVYFSTMDWEENELGSISSPWFCALFAGLDVCVTVISVSVVFSSHLILKSALLSLLSLVRVCAVYMYFPYHHLLANCFEAVRGLIVIWGVVLCIAGLSYDAGGLMPTLGFLLITPMLIYFNSLALASVQEHYLKTRQIASVAQLEHLIRGVLREKIELQRKKKKTRKEKTRKELVVEVINPFLEKMVEKFEREIASNTICLIWLLFFYRIQRDVVYIKVLRAQLCKQPLNLIDCVSVFHCFYVLEKWLLQIKDETEVVDFLSYQNDIEEAMDSDFQATKMLKDLLEEMGKRHSSFPRTVQLSHALSARMNKALAVYRALLAAHPKSIDVLTLFISFLDLIGQPSSQYASLLQKLEGGDSKRRLTKSLSMNEPGSVTFVISLENKDFGVVRWARNVDALGYKPGELIGSSHLILVPEPIRSNSHSGQHNALLRRGRMKSCNFHGAFSGNHLVYLSTRTGELVLGRWVIRLANERPNGDLVIVAAVQIQSEWEELAFVDLQTQMITAMVTASQTPAFKSFLRFNNVRNSFLFRRRLQERDFRESTVLYSTPNRTDPAVVLEIRCEVLKIFGDFDQPVLKMMQVTVKEVLFPSGAEICRSYTRESHNVNFEKDDLPDCEFSIIAKPSIDDRHGNSQASDSRSLAFANKLAEFQKTSQRHRKLFQATLAATVLMAVITPSLIVVFMEKATEELDTKVSEINLIGLRRFLSVTAALNSRELMLVGANYYSYWNESHARSELADVSAQMLAMRNDLENLLSSESGKYRRFLVEDLIPYWEWTGKDFQLFHMTLINVMTKIAHSAESLTKTDKVTVSDSDFLSLFRNGASESLHAFNSTLNSYITDASQARSGSEQALKVVVFTAMTLLCCLAVCAIAPIIFFSEAKRKQVWSSLLSFTAKEIAALKYQAIERLTEVHGLEEAKTYQHSESSSASGSYRMNGVMKTLVAAISAYLLIVCAELFLVYSIGALQPSNLLAEKPNYMHWSGYRRAMSRLSQFWLREVWLDRSPYSYSSLLACNSHDVSAKFSWEETIQELLDVNTGLTFGNSHQSLTNFPPSDTHKDLLQGNPCTGSCIPAATKGLSPLLFELVSAERVAISCLESMDGDYDACGALQAEELVSGALPLLEHAVTQFDSDSSASLQYYVTLIRVMTISFAIFSVLVYCLVFLPLIQKVTPPQNSRHWLQELSVMHYLPKTKVIDVLLTSARPGNDDGATSRKD